MITGQSRSTRPPGHPELDAYLSELRLLGPITEAHPNPSSPSKGADWRTWGRDGELGVWLTGTGTPAVVPGRAGPSTLIRCNDDVILVDCGNSCAYRLAELGVDLAQVTHVFITHHHFDHNIDLPFVILSPWLEKRDEYRAPQIIGPPGTTRFVERMLTLHEYDLRVRRLHGFRPERAMPHVVEIGDGGTVQGDGWRASAFDVDHYPVEVALGYSIATPGSTVVISGDTRACENLIASARGADLLIHEAIYEGYGFPDYHTLAADVGKVASAAAVRSLALTHLIPGTLPDEAWLEEVRRTFDGPVVVGRDLMKVL